MKRFLDEEGKWAWKYDDDVVVRANDKPEPEVKKEEPVIVVKKENKKKKK